MPIPFLNSITLNKNEIQEFKVYNLTPDPTLTSAGDYGYMWLNTSDSPKTLKWWDGTSIRSIVDSGNTSTLTVGTANDLSGGVAGSLPYQQGVGDTTFLGIGTANQVLTVNSGATAPQWLSQSSLSVGSATTATTATTATNVAGGANGSILVQSGAGTTGQLAIGANGYILTSNGTTPGWSATIPSSSVSGLAASATTDTTNASNISSGTLGLARLSLASGQFYVGDGSNNPAATAKSSIPLSGFGAAGADVAMGGFKITGLADPAAATDAATRGYVDSVAQGLDVKASCLVATTADITLASPGAVTIDGIYSATDFTAGTTRILVKDQSAPAENGIYIWQGPSSAMTRSADADTWDELVGAFTFIERGTANADSGWVCTSNAGGTLGTTAVTFVKFSQAGSYTAGNGIVQSGTSFNFAQSSAYTAGQIPFASSTTAMGFNANLHWDNANNRLGIGTATPSAPLHVEGANVILKNGTGVPYFQIAGRNTDGRAEFVFLNNGLSVNNAKLVGYTNTLAFEVAGSERLRIASDGVCTWSNVGGVAGTAMLLSGDGLKIGTGSGFNSSRLVVADASPKTSSGQSITLGTATGGANDFQLIVARTSNTTGCYYFQTVEQGVGYKNLVFQPDGGNVGIGTTTPQAKLHVSGAGIFSSQVLNGAGQIGWVNAKFTDWSDGNAIYISALQAGGGKWISGDGRYWDGGLWRSTTTTSTAISLDSGTIKFFTNSGLTANADFYPTERLRIDSSGNLGLGVTPSAWGAGMKALQVGAVSYGSLFDFGNGVTSLSSNLFFSGSSYGRMSTSSRWSMAYWQDITNGAHSWVTSTAAGTNASTPTMSTLMLLDASGRLMVGTASARSNFFNSSVTTQLQVEGDGAASFVRNVNDVYGGVLVLGKIRGASIVQNNDRVSQISFQGSDGTEFVECANISAEIDGAPGANDMPGRLVFSTTSDGAAAPTERLRIKSTGQLNFNGLASDPAGAAGDVYYNSGSNVFKVYDTGWKTLPRKYSTALAGTSTTFDVTHNLGTQDVTVMVRKSASTFDVVYTDIQVATTNKVTIVFASSVTGSDYTVTVIG